MSDEGSGVAYVDPSGSCGAARRRAETETRNGHLETVLTQRALRRITPPVSAYLLGHGIRDVRLAGGALLHGAAKDLDFWPSADQDAMKAWKRVVGESRYPVCRRVEDGTMVQLCMVEGRSLVELVESFDFAHCQVGVDVMHTKDNGWGVYAVHWTQHFECAMIAQGTYYTGGESAVNSLARVNGVAEKLRLDRGETRALILQVVEDVLKDPAGNLEKFKEFKLLKEGEA